LVQDVLEALADPRRRRILELVRAAELPAGAIAAEFGDVTRPAISQHLRVLREAGLVAERRDGVRRLYRTRSEGLTDVREFLDRFWDERLADLRREAETAERSRRRERGRDH
jgi:DNA-binding transcriptional ArsR family regulator